MDQLQSKSAMALNAPSLPRFYHPQRSGCVDSPYRRPCRVFGHGGSRTGCRMIRSGSEVSHGPPHRRLLRPSSRLACRRALSARRSWGPNHPFFSILLFALVAAIGAFIVLLVDRVLGRRCGSDRKTAQPEVLPCSASAGPSLPRWPKAGGEIGPTRPRTDTFGGRSTSANLAKTPRKSLIWRRGGDSNPRKSFRPSTV